MPFDEDRLLAAMVVRDSPSPELQDHISASPPPPTTQKRPHAGPSASSDNDLDADPAGADTTSFSDATPRQSVATFLNDQAATTNLSIFTDRECKRARLDEADTADVHRFNHLSVDKKFAQLYILYKSSSKNIVQIAENKKVWPGPSESLKANINRYAHAILIAPTLHGYREKLAQKHLLKIIVKERFDLPVDIEKNRAYWKDVQSLVSASLTGRRRIMKDEIKASKDKDIYTLALRLISKCESALTLEFIARVAMMRVVYFEQGKTGSDFWPAMDNMLEKVRENASKAADKALAASQALKFFIDEDITKYGTRDGGRPDLNGAEPCWIQDVNDIVDEIH